VALRCVLVHRDGGRPVHTHDAGGDPRIRSGGDHQVTGSDHRARQADGLKALLELAETSASSGGFPAAEPVTRAAGSPSAGAVSARSRRDLSRRHDQRGLGRGDGGVRAARQVPLQAREVIPGALNNRYEIPEVTFRRKRGRGLTLTCLFIGGVAAWRVMRGIPPLLVVCAIPAFATRVVSWLLSWFDKPVTVTLGQWDRLCRLHVTVAVPCYNEDAALLDRCLYALINQTRPAQLIWLVDDGSSEDYSALRRYWERTWPGGTEIRWTRQSNQGKRRAHSVVFGNVPETDIFVTVDSDTTLTANALEEGIKPFVKRQVLSVAGIEHGYNAEVNFLTRLQCCLQLFSQAVTGASWAVFGDMYTNRGPFALYRASLVQKILPVYRDEHFFGRRVILGDDSLLALAGSTYGKAVQQLTAFGLTMWPENLGHHIRQRIRWARGRAMRNFWRIKYRPLNSYCWWYTVSGFYIFLVSIGLVAILWAHWPKDRLAVGHALVGLVGMSIMISPRVLCIRKSSETWADRLLLIVMRPFAGVWASVVLARAVRIWGTITVLRQGWTTRQDGPELVLDSASPPEAARVLEEVPT
jgi:hyaluronan synthase